MTLPPKVVKMPCIDCGGSSKNHTVLAETSQTSTDDYGSPDGQTDYQICQCGGCDRISFREYAIYEYDVNVHGEYNATITTYPQVSRQEYVAVGIAELPEAVGRIYAETISALNAGAVTLGGGGLRAIVEAICLDQKVQGRNLQERIDDLVAKKLLAEPQAQWLHEERYIGNAALHELLPPSAQEVKDGLKIVEGLMQTIYVLPKHAEKLRKKREEKKP